MHRRLWWIGAVLFLSLNAYGQADRGSLTGTVKDSSGGVVPGATVTVLRDATGLTRTTVSSSTGAYSIPELPVGMYTATVALKGFQTVKFENVEIALEHTTTLNVELRVSSAATSGSRWWAARSSLMKPPTRWARILNSNRLRNFP